MSKKYTAANGQELTEEMIDRWCDAYEHGEFPEGERTVGDVVDGVPPLSSEAPSAITVDMPEGMRRAVEREASREGVTPAAWARSAIADRLLSASA